MSKENNEKILENMQEHTLQYSKKSILKAFDSSFDTEDIEDLYNTYSSAMNKLENAIEGEKKEKLLVLAKYYHYSINLYKLFIEKHNKLIEQHSEFKSDTIEELKKIEGELEELGLYRNVSAKGRFYEIEL